MLNQVYGIEIIIETFFIVGYLDFETACNNLVPHQFLKNDTIMGISYISMNLFVWLLIILWFYFAYKMLKMVLLKWL